MTGACFLTPRQTVNKESLIGSWNLLGISKRVVPVEQLGESDLLKGQITFNSDGTFYGDFIYPKTPEKNTKANGTYTLADGVLTISNQANNSTTNSELIMEKDVLIAKPLTRNGFAMYLRRAP